MIPEKRETLKMRVDSFLEQWHQFIVDFWWRKKYNVPFGSPKHREMNFIDMFIEFREEVKINTINSISELLRNKEENNLLGLSSENVVKMTQEEIDEEFENLDLSSFDKDTQ